MEIDWMPGYANSPSLKVHVDRLPEWDTLRFRRHDVRGGTAFWTTSEDGDGYVTFNFHDPRNQEGYGGRWFTYQMQFGEPVTVKGPWSSRTAQMNQWFPASVEAVYYQSEGPYPKLGYAGAILMAAVFDWGHFHGIPGAEVTFLHDHGSNDVDRELNEADRLAILGQLAFDTHHVIGRDVTMAFRRDDCKTFAESQIKKNEGGIPWRKSR